MDITKVTAQHKETERVFHQVTQAILANPSQVEITRFSSGALQLRCRTNDAQGKPADVSLDYKFFGDTPYSADMTVGGLEISLCRTDYARTTPISDATKELIGAKEVRIVEQELPKSVRLARLFNQGEGRLLKTVLNQI